MELWIRSQDKKHLVKCEAIMYEETGTGYGLRVFTKNYDFNIARYETKEIALEVLDEIQNILKPKYILDASSIKPDGDFYEENGVIFQNYDANAEIKELSTYVYEMPED